MTDHRPEVRGCLEKLLVWLTKVPYIDAQGREHKSFAAFFDLEPFTVRINEAEAALSAPPIEPVGMREALAKCLEELRWCSGSPDFNEGGQAREGWKRGPMLAIEQAVTALAACDKPVVEKVMEVSQLGFCSARLRDIGFTSSD